MSKPTTTSTRAAIYARVSLDHTGEHLAVERQRQDCLTIVKERGWTLAGEYVDNSISASDAKKQRPSYDQLVRDFAAGAFDALVVWDLDRLTRQPRQLEDWIDASTDRGLRLVTANGEADLGTDGGRMYARIKASVARAEIERKGVRQARALRQRAENGRPPLGVRLTGYTPSGEVVPDEADMVRVIFKMFAAGDSLRGITRWLTDHDHLTRRGSRWVPSTLRTMLTNPRYAGHAVYRGEVLDGVDGGWEPLVTPDVFALVQHRLEDPARKCNRRGTDRKYLGSSLYRCTCGDTVTSWSGNRYRCLNGCYSRSTRLVDETVRARVEARLASPDLRDLLVAATNTARAQELLVTIGGLRDRQKVIDADYDAGLIDGQRHKAATDRVTTELVVAEDEQVRLGAGAGPASVFNAPDPVAAFQGSSLMIQREVVDFLYVVTLLPANRGSKVFDPESVQIVRRGSEKADAA